MKIAFLTSIYPNHANLIYQQYPRLANKSSTEQEEFVRWHALSSYVRWFELLATNGFETCAFNQNLPEINLSWAKENHYSPKTNEPILEIGKEKIRRFDPDLIFCFSPITYIKNGSMKTLAETCSKPPKTIAWYGADQGDEEIFRNFDLTLSNSKHLVNRLNAKGINSDFLQHSFDPVILDKIYLSKKRKNRAVFFGNLDTTTTDFSQRTKLLEEISITTKELDIFGDIDRPTSRERIHHAAIRFRSCFSNKCCNFINHSKIAYWAEKSNLPPNPWQLSKRFTQRIKPPMFGAEMLQTLASYNIAINHHNKHTGDHACNMRLFETTGLGCALVTEKKKDLADYFENEHEVLAYSTKEEATEFISHLVNHPSVANEMGAKAQRRAVSEYNTYNQIQNLTEIISRQDLN